MTLSPFIANTLAQAAAKPSLLQPMARALEQQWQAEPQDADAWMERMLTTQRLLKMHAAGVGHDQTLIDEMRPYFERTWANEAGLPAPIGRQALIARTMLKEVGLYPSPAVDTPVLRLDASYVSKHMVQAVAEHCIAQNIPLDIATDDGEFNAALVNRLDDTQLEGLMELTRARMKPVTHQLFVNTMEPDASGAMQADKATKLFNVAREAAVRRRNDEIQWCLTRVPTESEATRDGASYPDYIQFYLDACDQPWDAIKHAQQKLIDVFDKGEAIHITNADGTDLTLSIKGQTFANSVITRNLPGSEIFSAPVRNSVNGTLVAKGKFCIDFAGTFHEMENITLTIKNGRIEQAFAEKGNDSLQKLISIDDHLDPEDPHFEGARHFGEIGFGTNPFIQQHLANRLLVEKISGSVHLAAGGCYGDRYLGRTVKLSNGNQSRLHWDITTMLRGKSGRIELDGHLIQENGRWLACPELGIVEKDIAVLNEGWKALPEHQQPKHWRERYAAEASRIR